MSWRLDSHLPHPARRRWLRARERRLQFSSFVANLAEGLNHTAFEWMQLDQALRRLFPVRSLRIHESLDLGHTAMAQSAGSDGLVVQVPVQPGRLMTFEIQFAAPEYIDDWTRQTVLDAARIVALAVAAHRARALLAAEAARRCPLDRAAPLIGSSLAMRHLRYRIERLAPTDFTVLIEGESGTGKELVARQLHDLGPRRRGPFVAVNCAAIVETLLEAELFGIEDRTATGVRGRRGKFELAHGGTLFLDEVGDLSPAAQAKLLRAIQELAIERVGSHTVRPVDARIVVATNRSLRELVERHNFRADLYYRLGGVEIHVPPLRERRDDVLELARYFLQRLGRGRGVDLSVTAADALLTYDWPGNVRELERVIEHAVALTSSPNIELDDLPPRVTGRYSEILQDSLRCEDTLRVWASRYARLVLQRSANNKRLACRKLGISYHTLRAYLRHQPTPAVNMPVSDERRPGLAPQAMLLPQSGRPASPTLQVLEPATADSARENPQW